jgi:hypothetical protein
MNAIRNLIDFFFSSHSRRSCRRSGVYKTAIRRAAAAAAAVAAERVIKAHKEKKGARVNLAPLKNEMT